MNFETFKSRLLGLDDRLVEDEIYRIVWEEIESNQLDRSAQARSIEEGSGDKGKTQSAYVRHRVRRLKDELEIHRRDLEKHNKQTNAAEKPASRTNKSPPKKARQTCSLCGAKLGLFSSGDLCRACTKVLSRNW